MGLSKLVNSQPYEAYPIADQLPPVARVGEQFTFQISNDTYKSSVSQSTQIAYEAHELPSWLSFDPSSRVLSGSASSGDLSNDAEQYFTFILEGTDPSDNSKSNFTHQLVLSNRSSVEIAANFNLLALLKNYGSTNGKSGIILSPNEIFNVTFDRSTFASNNAIVAYYGRMKQYNAPLPNWLFFDQNNLKFSGRAPVVNSDIAPQTTYSLTLIATDIENFAGVEVPFDLVIGAHELTTTIQNSLLVNVTSSGEFHYELPLDYVFFDGNQITAQELGSMDLVGAPTWVELNNDTLSGTMSTDESSSNSANFSVAVYDTFADVIYFNFRIESTNQLFAVPSLSNINATRDDWFEYNFLPSQFTEYSDTNVSIAFTNSTQSHNWINFRSSNLTLSGMVPEDLDSLALSLIASRGSVRQSLDFQIIGMDSTERHLNRTHNSTTSLRSSSTSSTSLPSSTSGSNPVTTTSSAATSSPTTSAGTAPLMLNSSSRRTTAIACGVAIPLGLIAIFALIFFLFWRRRKSKNADDAEKFANISGPDVNNSANRPNQASALATAGAFDDPFDDLNAHAGTDAQRLGALNAMKLDEVSSSNSEGSTIDEKTSSLDNKDIYLDNDVSHSAEELLPNPPPNGNFFDPQNRSSSVYLDSEPANRKSWRYKLSPMKIQDSKTRDSCTSASTVSTTDFMNTIIKDDQPLPKDPRKSTLGLRDSVFWNKMSPAKKPMNNLSQQLESQNSMIPNLDDQSHASSNYRTETSPTSTFSDEFVPVKNGNNYSWVQRSKPNRQPSGKRLVKTPNLGDVNVSQAAEVEGHVPEQI